MRVLVATDAWHPQVNGVVRTYERLALEAPKLGFEVSFLAPPLFRTLPCPTYPEIRLALAGPRAIARHVAEFRPDFIHIATEGPIGLMTRRYCRKTRWPFTTSYHTRFPEYVAARLPIPEDWCYALQRRFHNGSAGTFVATQSVLDDLAARGFERLMPWSRGVDTELFRPRKVRLFGEQPVFLYVGRIAVEKNIKAFLDLDLPGRKVLVGGGPQARELGRLYPDAIFTGPREGEELAEAYASADVFVFPSLTDTFGLVLLEALACGVPVAAYPVSGPKDVLTDPEAGVLSLDLREAALQALVLRREVGTGACAPLQLGELRAPIHREHDAGPQSRPAAETRPLSPMARQAERAKENGPVGGEPGRFTLMRQFGGRFGGNRVRLKMVSGLARFKRAIQNLRPHDPII